MNEFCRNLHEVEVVEAPLGDEGMAETPRASLQQRASNRIADRLDRARVMISNARSDSEISTLLTASGYGATMLEEGQSLYDAALALHQEVRASYGQRDAVGQRFRTVWQAARFGYNRDLRMARRVLQNDADAAKTLLLPGPRKGSFAGWLDQAKQFYTKVLASPVYLVKLQVVGITEQVLLAHQQLMLDAVDARLVRAEALAASQRLQRERNAQLAALELWLAGIRAAAEVALINRPELLHKLLLTPVSGVELAKGVASDGPDNEGTMMPPVYQVP